MSATAVVLHFAGGLPRSDTHSEKSMHEADLPDLQTCFRSISGDDRARLVQQSRIRHARLQNFATCIGTLAARAVLADAASCEPEGRGVLATGGPVHFDVAWRATRQILEEGPDMLNPLLFPQTLPSAIPTAIGAQIEAKAFAYCTGHDRLAFFDALKLATQSLRHQRALQVLVVSAFDGESLHEASSQLADSNVPWGTAALCFRIEIGHVKTRHLSVLEVACRKPAAPAKRPGQLCFFARWTARDKLRCDQESALKHLDAGPTSGAVWFVESALRVGRQSTPLFQAPFLVTCEQDGVWSWATAQWIDGRA